MPTPTCFAYNVKPLFCVINFDDPRRSNRCNPIAPEFMTDISDTYESAYTIMLNLNKTWILESRTHVDGEPFKINENDLRFWSQT